MQTYAAGVIDDVEVADVNAFAHLVRAFGGTPYLGDDPIGGSVSPASAPAPYVVSAGFDDGISDYGYDPETDEEIEGEFFSLVAPLLADGAVLIYTYGGHEGLRAAFGSAVAVNRAGETRTVNLYSIHELAKELAPQPVVEAQPVVEQPRPIEELLEAFEAGHVMRPIDFRALVEHARTQTTTQG